MFTLIVFSVIGIPLGLLGLGLYFERKRNKRRGVLGLEYIPIVIAFSVYEAKLERKQAKFEAKYKALKSMKGKYHG